MDYSYDYAGQLIGATDSTDSLADEGYDFDPTGNRQSTTTGASTTASITGANNTLVSDGTYTYQYDAEGNRIEQTNIATGEYSTYSYDYRQRLTTVTDYTNTGFVTQIVVYNYDALDRRISEAITVGGVTTTSKFIYDGQNIVATLDGTNALTNRFLDGPAADQVFADEQFAPTSSGELPASSGNVMWPLVDNLGTDRDLVEYNTQAGLTSVVDHLAYGSFGSVTSETSPAINYLFGFTGFIRDSGTGLDHSLTRDYDPSNGQWTQEDSFAFYGHDADLSRYVSNSPVEYIDPTGMKKTIANVKATWLTSPYFSNPDNLAAAFEALEATVTLDKLVQIANLSTSLVGESAEQALALVDQQFGRISPVARMHKRL